MSITLKANVLPSWFLINRTEAIIQIAVKLLMDLKGWNEMSI